MLFCDQREIETYRFTCEKAFAIVDQVVTSFNDPAKKPNPCEYCSWCAKADTCPARLAMVGETLAVTSASAVRYDAAQSLSDAQKSAARTNIGAGIVMDIPNLLQISCSTTELSRPDPCGRPACSYSGPGGKRKSG